MGYDVDEVATEPPINYLEEIDPQQSYRIVMPLVDDAIDTGHPRLARLIETAGAFARINQGELLVLGVVRIPRQTPLEAARESAFVGENVRTLQTVVDRATNGPTTVRGACVLGRDPTTAILHGTRISDCDALMMGVAPEHPRRRLLRRDPVESILAAAECDVYAIKPTEREAPPERALLAISSGPHSALATAATATVVTGFDIDSVTVMHAIEPDVDSERRAEARSIVDAARRALERDAAVTADVVETENVRQSIIDQAAEHDISVLGAPTASMLKRFAFGSVPDSVKQEIGGAVLTARSRDARDRSDP